MRIPDTHHLRCRHHVARFRIARVAAVVGVLFKISCFVYISANPQRIPKKRYFLESMTKRCSFTPPQSF